MHANPLGIIAMIAGVTAFVGCYAALRPRCLATRLKVLTVCALPAIPSVLFATYYLHILPEWAWFYTLRSWPGSEFLVVFLGMFTGTVASLMPRLLLGLPLSALLAFAAIPYIKPIIGPLKDSELTELWDDDICRQSAPSTCGPASVATIIRHLGGNPSEHAAARAAYTYDGGTEAWYLARYVRSMGFVPRFAIRKTFTPEIGQPALVGVRFGSVGHFIAVLDISDNQVTFADPASGLIRMPINKFLHHYDFTGFHMVVSRDNHLGVR